MYRNLGKLSDLIPEIPGASAFLEALDDFDISFLERVNLLHWDFRDTRDGVYGELALAFEGELELSLPQMDFLAFAFGANTAGYTFIHAALVLGERSRLDLYDLQLNLRLQHDFIRPASLDPAIPPPNLLDIPLRGSFTIDTEINTEARLDHFSLPPFEIAETGIILALTGCGFDLSEISTPEEVSALGYDASFRGIFAKSAHFRWLPQLDFEGFKGLVLNFENVVLGQGGVSFDFEKTWQVAYDENGFLPETEVLGHLFDPARELGIGRVKAVVRQSVPIQVFASGFMEEPLLRTVFGAEFGLSFQDGTWQTSLRLFKDPAIATAIVEIGQALLSFQVFDLSGIIGEETFSLQGEFQGSLQVPGFDLQVSHAAIALQHGQGSKLLKIELQGVEFGPLGEVETASLFYRSEKKADTGEESFSLQMATELSWNDIQERLHLDELPDAFPLPPDDARLTAFLSWEEAPSTKVVLRFSAELPDPSSLWRFIPPEFQPEVRELQFAFEAEYTDMAQFQNGSTDSSFEGEVFVKMDFRMPDLPNIPGAELFQIETGDEEGWLNAKILAGTRPNTETGDQEAFLDFDLANPLTLDINLPGLPQPVPPIHISISKIEADLSFSDEAEGSFALIGDFRLRPIDPPPFLPLGEQLKLLLAPLELNDLVGNAQLELAFKDEKAAISLECGFEDAEIELDVFDMIADLASGLSGQGGDSEGSEFPLDIDIVFGLKGLKMQLGSLGENAGEAQFSLEMVIRLGLAGLSTDLYFLLSDQEFSLGLNEGFAIPLEIPRFPLSPDELTGLAEEGGTWTLEKGQEYLQTQQAIIDAMAFADDDPEAKRLKAQLQAQNFLLKNILGIFEAVSPSNRGIYQTYVELLVGLFHLTTNALHVESSVELVLIGRQMDDGSINPNGVKFIIPFGDPRGISLKGGAYLNGFGEDDPFRVLQGLQLGLGLSSDMIFFSLDSLGSPIELPKIGPYEGASINLSRFRIGYGYSRNSFALDFAGSFVLPEKLVEDADTSKLIGAGIRLPTHNALSFRLDLIPVVLGAVEFIVPLFDFNLDLRKPNAQGVVGTRNCTPYWDGLQVVVPGIYHDAFKHAAFSPMFGPMVIPNFRFDGDVMIGDDKNGLTVIADDVLVLLGFWTGGYTMISINFLAHPFEPFFNNFCVNIRLAGFRLNFNLQRPFPSFSPLALFEVLGLLSDPGMPIDPNGSLANTLRISLTDAYLTLPPALADIFPGQAGTIEKPLQITLNLGTLITAVQAGVKVGKEVVEILEQESKDLEVRLRQLKNNPPKLEVGTLLSVLPPELRKFRLSASLAGFEASAVLLLMDANDLDGLKKEMSSRSEGIDRFEPDEFVLGSSPDPEEMTRFRPNLQPIPGQGRSHFSGDPEGNLFRGIEFEAFEEHDLENIPVQDQAENASGLVLGAHVKVFKGQRFRFLGFLFDNGAFSMITTAEVKPLQLSVAGLKITFPFQAQGRLLLQGRQKRDGFYGRISATGSGKWNILPGVMRLEVGLEGKPARLELFGDGKFRVVAGLVLSLFQDAAVIDGQVDISDKHCLLSGSFKYMVGEQLDLRLAVEGRVGPGKTFSLQGKGSLNIEGFHLGNVVGSISDDQASIEGSLTSNKWKLGGLEIPCNLALRAKGLIKLRPKAQAEFLLTGEGKMRFHGAEIKGRGGIQRKQGQLSTYMEGTLLWQGNSWLGGRMEASQEGLRLIGRTNFTLNLTPANMAGTDLAHLFLGLDLSADFVLDPEGGMASFSLRGSCTLAAKLPGDSGQVFPLAIKEINVAGGVDLDLPLLNISGFVRVPFDGVQIPVPKVSGKTPPSAVRFGFIAGSPAVSWAGTTVTLAGGVVPIVTPGSLSDDQTNRKAFLAYDISFDNEESLEIELPINGDAKVGLAWREKKLAVCLQKGNDSPEYTFIEDVFQSSN